MFNVPHSQDDQRPLKVRMIMVPIQPVWSLHPPHPSAVSQRPPRPLGTALRGSAWKNVVIGGRRVKTGSRRGLGVTLVLQTGVELGLSGFNKTIRTLMLWRSSLWSMSSSISPTTQMLSPRTMCRPSTTWCEVFQHIGMWRTFQGVQMCSTFQCAGWFCRMCGRGIHGVQMCKVFHCL